MIKVNTFSRRSILPNAPMSLIQWLSAHEYKEAGQAVLAYKSEVDFFYRDLGLKQEAALAIGEWLAENDNTQNCFIGTHGIRNLNGEILGIGAAGDRDRFATWEEVWNWFGSGRFLGGLWLGSCYSSAAAEAFAPLWATSRQLLVPYIFGFSDSILPKEIEEILFKLIDFSDINNRLYLDQQLDGLRRAVPGTKIELFYPAADKSGYQRYVNVDRFDEEVGISFSQHLENNRNRMPYGIAFKNRTPGRGLHS
jgi:hypothetical protein